jgi:outer membrane protein assembly factor BamB
MSSLQTVAREEAVRPRRRRYRFPLIVTGLIVLAFVVPRASQWAELDPGPLMYIKMAATWSSMLAVVLLAAWFFLFSGIRPRTRLLVLGVLLFCAGSAAAAIKKVEFTGDWHPIFIYRWEADPADLLDAHRGHLPATDDLQPVDLTIDAVRDWPRFRGSRCDGVVGGLTLATDWKASPPRQVWRQPAGGGYAAFAVAGNVAVTIEQRRDQEVVVCYDRATGRERWVYAYPALFHRSEPMGGDGPRATPTIADGLVYSLGATGHLACVNGRDGSPKWAINVLEDAGAKNADWGMSGSPLVVDDLIIVNPGVDPAQNAGRALTAYDRKTGKRVWAVGNRPAAYASPQLATLAGQRQVLVFDRPGLAAFDPQTGRQLWDYPWETMMGMNMIQPLVIGDDRVLISSELGNGAALLRVRRQGDDFVVEEVWNNRRFASKFSSPVFHKGHIYGLNYGMLTCLDAQTGQQRWKDGRRFGHGQLLLVGDVLLILGEGGDLALVAADPTGYRELSRLPVFRGKTWNTPALAGRQLFIRTHAEMACFELGVTSTALSAR